MTRKETWIWKENVILKNYIYDKKSRKKDKIVLSENLSKILIKDIHNTYCHLGRTQMINKITSF